MNSDPRLLLLLDLLLKSTVVLSLALLAARLWRGASAANRHLVWLAAFAVLLLAPLTVLIPPRWSWQPARVPTPATAPAAPLVTSSQAAANAPLPTTVSAATAPTPAAPRAFVWPVWLTLRNALPLVWLVGALALLARLAAGAAQLWQRRRRSAPLDDARALSLGRQIAASLRLKRAVELRVLASCRVPMTWGVLRPVVLLPAEAAGWPESRLALVLRHELGHVARHDWLARLLTQAAAALYWPNPLVWLADRAARLAQEQACDDLVLAAGVPAEDYALELVAAARRLHGRYPAGPAVAMAEPSTLGKRVDGIITARRDRRPIARRTMAAVAVAAVLTLAFCVLAQVRAAEPTKLSVPSPLEGDGQPRVPPVPVVGEKVVSTSVAKLPPPDPTDTLPRVVIEAKFIQVAQGEFDLKELAPYDLNAQAGRSAQWSGRLDVRAVVRALEAKPGSELLSSPSVAVRSGYRATVKVGQELRYPQSYTATGEPTDFISRTVGVELEATATLTSDNHAIKLDVHPLVTEFEGFVQYEGVKFQPVFSVREITSQVWMLDGDTLVLGGLTSKRQVAPAGVSAGRAKAIAPDQLAKPNAENAKQTELFIFITARIVK
jgi:beta-lactamase regulating signal transducer with metallopeptidase domain